MAWRSRVAGTVLVTATSVTSPGRARAAHAVGDLLEHARARSERLDFV